MKKLRYLSSVLALAVASGAMAIPAKKGTRTVEQPDGTTLKIKVVGDEYLHFTTLEDGTLIQMDEDGFYKIASIDDTGAVISTGLKIGTPKGNETSIKLQDLNLQDLNSRRKAKRRVPQSGMGRTGKGYPSTGSPKGLIILVEYTDVKFNSANNYDAKNYFNEMINGENFSQFGGTGSALEYFTEQSGGKFIPDFDIFGPVQLPNSRKYYGGNDRYGDDANAHLMVTDAIAILDPQVDFSVYDTDGDGVIDNVYIFYAGQGEADFGSPDTVWPHSWDVRAGGITKRADGKLIGTYACSNEWEQRKPSGVGSFIHEFSHVMGLPDLYHTSSYNALYTPQDYSVLDYGPYNNDGRTPPNYGAYEKNAMGWYEPILLDHPCSVTLNEISSGEFALIPTEKEKEFFLLENRQNQGWDKYIPGHGMLIWHIDYDEFVFEYNQVNNTEKHQYVDIVEANGKPTGELKDMRGYPFPGTTGKTEFTATTTPALKSWSGLAIDLPISEISEKDGIITFNVAGGGDEVSAQVESLTVEAYDTEYFSLQGIRLVKPEKGQLVIEKCGREVRKVIY